MKKFIPLLILVVTTGLSSCQTDEKAANKSLTYPETKKVDTVDTYFGTKVPDPYRWLEDDLSDKTAEWVKAQNEVTHSYLSQIDFRDKIKERLKVLFDYERVSAPFEEGNYEYYYLNDGLQNQSVLYRTDKGNKNKEVFLDPNKFSKDGTISLTEVSFTEDGLLCAYLISISGSDWRKGIVMNTATKEILEDTLHNIKFSGISWKGNEGFYYSSYDKPKVGGELSAKTQLHKLYYHKLGTPQASDTLVFGGEENPYRYIMARVTEDNRYLVIAAAESTSGNKLFIQDLENNAPIVLVDDNLETEEYVLHTEGDRILIQTNHESPNQRVVQTTIADPTLPTWEDVIPETENVMSATMGGGYIFTNYLVDAKTEIKQYTTKGELVRSVELPAIGSVYGFSTDQDKDFLYYTFTSFVYPSSIYKFDIASGKSELYRQPEIDFNPDEYETKQVFYTSKDGTKVPMFIVHKKGVVLNGKNPTELYAYGGFNVSLTPSFSIEMVLWLENGGIYAQPNIRGGGEYGEKWHKAGTKMQKQNVFDDFIAAAEWLFENNYTSSDYLALRGGSNGGLLVGATMAQRPDLAKVAIPAVGVMDMLRYHKFTAGAGWASDYGTAEDSEEMFHYLKNYSPIHALKPGVSYPATLITTADHDDRVVPAHSFKFAATLQEHHRGNNPVLIRIETNAGHGEGTPVSKKIEQAADRFAFTWYNMGIIPDIAKKDM